MAAFRAPRIIPGTIGMVAAGYDPSIANGGITGIRRKAVNGFECLGFKVIRTSPEDLIEFRLGEIAGQIGSCLREWRPEVFVIEEQANVQAGKYETGEITADNTKTLMAVGAAVGIAKAYGVRVVFKGARTIKRTVLGHGNANADKKQLRARMLRILNLKSMPLDCSDAGAMAICGLLEI